MHPRPGEIWPADLGLAAKTRPVAIVSRYDPDAPRALIVYVPLTTQNRESRYEVPIPKFGFLNAASFAKVQGIASIPSVRQERKLRCEPKGTTGRSASPLERTLRGTGPETSAHAPPVCPYSLLSRASNVERQPKPSVFL